VPAGLFMVSSLPDRGAFHRLVQIFYFTFMIERSFY
jgi:hypothetical protein